MMKNKKLLVVFILMLVFLLTTVTYTKATDEVSNFPTIVTDPNTQQGNTNAETNNQTGNNQATGTLNVTGNTNAEKGNNETLPQTGVQEDTTLLIFIGICVASAIYAYVRIRKYNGIR